MYSRLFELPQRNPQPELQTQNLNKRKPGKTRFLNVQANKKPLVLDQEASQLIGTSRMPQFP